MSSFIKKLERIVMITTLLKPRVLRVLNISLNDLHIIKVTEMLGSMETKYFVYLWEVLLNLFTQKYALNLYVTCHVCNFTQIVPSQLVLTLPSPSRGWEPWVEVRSLKINLLNQRYYYYYTMEASRELSCDVFR